MRCKHLYTIIFLSFWSLSIFGQVDTRFWLAAPEVTVNHADRPVYLRISSFQKAATIVVSQPANPNFITITQTIEANKTISIDLTNQLDEIENSTPNVVLPYGILITSTEPITAYYEVLGTSYYGIVNTDILSLKGSYALGLKFLTPFQTHWDNYAPLDAWSSFDVVATENNTSITITPTKALLGHPAGVSFSIVLQRGETYSCRSASPLGAERPTGSLIVANKPIAVTVKDDSILQGTNYDLLSDQLIPVNFTGKEYIAMKISTTINSDRLYIVAANPNTEVFLDGNPSPLVTLAEGESYEHLMLNETTYITSSDSVYVWHVGGFVNELGAAILPPLGCTGSRQISFTRSTDEPFLLNLLVKSGFENNFTINGTNALIPESFFSDVQGTGGLWKFANISISNEDIPTNSANLIKNELADFHLGILNGGLITGFRYGYFSDFGFLELGNERFVCEGDSIVLDAGFFQDTYSWNTGAVGQFIYAKDTGYYSVDVVKGVCSNKDSVKLSFYPKIETIVLGSDTAICANRGIILKTVLPYSSYLWNSGERTPNIRPSLSGNYTVTVSNKEGCKKSDTINVTFYPIPFPSIVFTTELERFCKDSIVLLSTDQPYSRYLWNSGETTQSITTVHNEHDYFQVDVWNDNNCQNTTSIKLDCSPIIGLIPNLITPNGDKKNDFFFIEYLRSTKWSLEVYNGWGDRVYQNLSYDNSFDGKNLSEGVYYFLLKHVENKGNYRGWLHLIR